MSTWLQVSLNQVIDSLNNFSTAHKQLHSFRYGKNEEQELSESTVFPELAAYPVSVNVTEHTMEYTIKIEIYDLEQNSENNVQDVQSDLLQVCVDAINFLRRNQGYYWNVKSSTTATPFSQRNTSVLAGWSFNVTLVAINNGNICDIPGVDPNEALSLDFTDAVAGCFNFPCMSATTLYGGTIYSGTTPLSQIIQTIASGADTNDLTRVQPGYNIVTGGTGNFPVIHTTGSPNFSGTGIFVGLSATTLSGGTIFSGSTDLSLIFQTIASDNNDITRIQPGTNTLTGGTGNLPTVNIVASPSLNGLTLSGTGTATAFSALTLSGTSIFSGSTPLAQIIQLFDTNDITRVQPGSNITTGGTDNLPTISVVQSPSFGNVSASGTGTFNVFTASTISGGTFFSGSTPLSVIIQTIASGADSNDITRVQPGANIQTGGTVNFPVVSTVDSPNFNNLNSSGITSGAGLRFQTISGGTLSGGTIFSGATELSTIIQSYIAGSSTFTTVQPGSNITTGGTSTSPIVSLTASPSINSLTSSGTGLFNLFSGTSISGGTFFSGSTPLSQIIQTIASGADTNDITRVQPGYNIVTGGTGNLPVIHTTGSPNFSGTGTFVGLSASTISGSTLYSGSTDLSLIFQTIGSDNNDVTRVQPGSNINTGGTGNLPTVSLVASPSINNLSVSGTGTFTSLSGVSVSGLTFYSGTTPLSQIMQLFDTNDITRIQPGSNITTGGTDNLPSVSLTASPSINNLTVSGTGLFNLFSGTSVSGGTFFSGSTPLGVIIQSFIPVDQNDITRVQPGNNILTGGSMNFPTVNLVDSPFVNNITVSGTGFYNLLSGTSISGGTYFSGSTPLSQIIQSFADGNDITRVQPGYNIVTGGTGNLPVIHTTGSPNFSGTGTFIAVSAVTLSAGTLYSGTTNLSAIFGGLTASTYESLVVAASDETTQIVSASTAAMTFRMPYGCTLSSVRASLSTSGSTTTTVDVQKAGATIFSTKITLASGNHTSLTAATPSVLSVTALREDDPMSVIINGAGTGAKGLKVTFTSYRNN